MVEMRLKPYNTLFQSYILYFVINSENCKSFIFQVFGLKLCWGVMLFPTTVHRKELNRGLLGGS